VGRTVRRLLLVAALAVGLLVTCGVVARFRPEPPAAPLDCPNLRPGDQDVRLIVGGAERRCRLHLPPRAVVGQPLPLVIVLHGGGQRGGRAIQTACGMDPVADAHEFITAYPTGGARGWGGGYTWNAGDCCGAAAAAGADDVGFLSALIDALVEGRRVDARRVFVTGVSNGGMMAHRVGCELADKVAAIAPIAGPLMFSRCEPARPISVMILHGTDDRFVPWAGGGRFERAGARRPFLSAEQARDAWAHLDGCGSETHVEYQRGEVTCAANEACKAGADVLLCRVEGGGHTWPGGANHLDWWIGHTTRDISSEDMWQFFSRHPMIERGGTP